MLKTMADVLKDILIECWFTFETRKITMTNVDPEKIVAIHLELQPSDKYACTTEFQFPFYIQTLYKVLRGVKARDVAILTDGPNNVLQIAILEKGEITKNQITLQPLQNVLPVVYARHPFIAESPEMEFDTADLYRILHDLSAVSRKIGIMVQDQTITFTAQDDCGSISVFSKPFLSYPVKTYQYKETFLIKYLEKFAKPTLKKTITLRLTPGAPLSAIYKLENGFLELSIAPLG